MQTDNKRAKENFPHPLTHYARKDVRRKLSDLKPLLRPPHFQRLQRRDSEHFSRSLSFSLGLVFGPKKARQVLQVLKIRNFHISVLSNEVMSLEDCDRTACNIAETKQNTAEDEVLYTSLSSLEVLIGLESAYSHSQ